MPAHRHTSDSQRSYKMENITDVYGIEHIIIDRGNGEFTSMPKSVYDAQAKELTESVTKAK